MNSHLDNLTEALLRQSRPRVVAAFVRVFKDLDLAEDLYQEACLRALKSWPVKSIPDDAVGWLVRVGRNAGIDQIRRNSKVVSADVTEILETNLPENDIERDLVQALDSDVYRDDVLRLMFMCCHPHLQQTDQLALAMKVVVGFSVSEVARAFLAKPAAMERRITRAKKRASAVATALEVPSFIERGKRLLAVEKMIYLLFNEGYSAGEGDDHLRLTLCDEAIRLARLLLELFPQQTEVMGLLALILLQHSRHKARLDADGHIVLLEDQDRTLWDAEMIAEGRVLIEKALRAGRTGPLQVQAAIAAVHCASEQAIQTDWHEIEQLYGVLEAIEPSPVVRLNRAVAIWKVAGAQSALLALKDVSVALENYRPFHATRAVFLTDLEAWGEAQLAYERALQFDLTTAERTFLENKLSDISKKIH